MVGVIGLVFVLAIELIRALVPSELAARKPLSCNVCMASWCAIAASVIAYYKGVPPILPIAAGGFALGALDVLRWLRASANLASPPL